VQKKTNLVFSSPARRNIAQWDCRKPRHCKKFSGRLRGTKQCPKLHGNLIGMLPNGIALSPQA